MDTPELADQQGITYIRFLRIHDSVSRTCLERWTIEIDGERERVRERENQGTPCYQDAFTIIIIIIIYSFRVFHSSASSWFFTGVWVTASIFRYPVLASLFWPFSAMLSFWIVSTRPPTSKSSKPFNNPLVIVPKSPIIIGTIVTFMFHSFFNSLARSRYLSFVFHIPSLVSRDSKVDNFANSLFCCCWLLWGLVFWSGLGDPFVC